MEITNFEEQFYSRAENSIVLELQISKKMHTISRQFGIGKYFADFYFPELKLVLEIDGYAYHSSDEAIEHDSIRNKFMNENGYTVVRATGKMAFKNPSGLLNILRLFPKGRTFFIESDSDILLVQKLALESSGL